MGNHDHTDFPDTGAERPVTPLLAVLVAAVLAGYALIRVSAGSSSAWLGALLGVAVACGGGLVLGRWWPAVSAVDLRETVDARRDASVPSSSGDDETIPMPGTVSALLDEEHIVGDERRIDDERAAANDQAADAHIGSLDEPEQAPDPELDPGPDPEPTEDRAYGHDVITPDQLINDDHPTVAMHLPAATPVAIDDKPLAEALVAKDEVIRSLENIVKENRDKWADFEAEREALTTRLQRLEAELRVANDLIEHGGDELADAVAEPQVLNRV